MQPIEILERMSRLRILVVGDLMLDHYIWGDVHRISPEAPVPVISARRETWAAGGAANVALNLASLGVQTHLLGSVGRDDAGTRLQQLLNEKGIKLLVDAPINTQAVETIVKTRVLARTQQVCRIDRESRYSAYAIDDRLSLMDCLDQTMEVVDAVIVSDYAKGVINQPLLDRILSHRHRRFVAIDPKPTRALRFSGVDLLTPNRGEAVQLSGIAEPPLGERFPLDEICARIQAFLQPQSLIITLGAEGMAVCESGILKSIMPTQAQEVFDVSGAGDTVIATLTAAMVAGADSIRAAQLANAAAGCVVAHVGTEPIRLHELYAKLGFKMPEGESSSVENCK